MGPVSASLTVPTLLFTGPGPSGHRYCRALQLNNKCKSVPVEKQATVQIFHSEYKNFKSVTAKPTRATSLEESLWSWRKLRSSKSFLGTALFPEQVCHEPLDCIHLHYIANYIRFCSSFVQRVWLQKVHEYIYFPPLIKNNDVLGKRVTYFAKCTVRWCVSLHMSQQYRLRNWEM